MLIQVFPTTLLYINVLLIKFMFKKETQLSFFPKMSSPKIYSIHRKTFQNIR